MIIQGANVLPTCFHCHSFDYWLWDYNNRPIWHTTSSFGIVGTGFVKKKSPAGFRLLRFLNSAKSFRRAVFTVETAADSVIRWGCYWVSLTASSSCTGIARCRWLAAWFSCRRLHTYLKSWCIVSEDHPVHLLVDRTLESCTVHLRCNRCRHSDRTGRWLTCALQATANKSSYNEYVPILSALLVDGEARCLSPNCEEDQYP